MNQSHLSLSRLIRRLREGLVFGGPLTEWLPSVRFISAKGPPEDQAPEAPRSPLPRRCAIDVRTVVAAEVRTRTTAQGLARGGTLWRK
jgi:hypothetical protein